MSTYTSVSVSFCVETDSAADAGRAVADLLPSQPDNNTSTLVESWQILTPPGAATGAGQEETLRNELTDQQNAAYPLLVQVLRDAAGEIVDWESGDGADEKSAASMLEEINYVLVEAGEDGL